MTDQLTDEARSLNFRKKPVIIQAFQMTQARRMDNSDWPEWLHRAWNGGRNEAGTLQRADMAAQMPDILEIVTLEGNHRVSWGDWIIRGVQGELYPCKPDVFEATYEPAHRRATPADDLRALLARVPSALSNAFGAGIEEREGGSARRQAKLMEPVDALREEIRAALSQKAGDEQPAAPADDLRAALIAAIKPQLSEGIGAILRKFCDSPAAVVARDYLHRMPDSDWETLTYMLAEAAADATLSQKGGDA